MPAATTIRTCGGRSCPSWHGRSWACWAEDIEMSRKPDWGGDDPGDTYPGSQLEADAVEFGAAMDAYKRKKGLTYPTWSQVLEVFRSLGYRKVMPEPNVLGSNVGQAE